MADGLGGSMLVRGAVCFNDSGCVHDAKGGGGGSFSLGGGGTVCFGVGRNDWRVDFVIIRYRLSVV